MNNFNETSPKRASTIDFPTGIDVEVGSAIKTLMSNNACILANSFFGVRSAMGDTHRTAERDLNKIYCGSHSFSAMSAKAVPAWVI